VASMIFDNLNVVRVACPVAHRNSLPLESYGVGNRELCERCKGRQIRGKELKNISPNMLTCNGLTLESPAFCRKPLRQNVRLLFAFCSLNFYIFFVSEMRTVGAVGVWRRHATTGLKPGVNEMGACARPSASTLAIALPAASESGRRDGFVRFRPV
jgi:hypothetical protein